MSISVMKEGEVMGRGVKPGKVEARTRARLKAAPDTGSPVVVLGAGPAGLLAAHAVALAGGDPVIFSAPGEDGTPVKSPMAGAIYLHMPIPDITSGEPDGVIDFVKIGSRENYALKLYNSRYAPCSWDKFDSGEKPAWAMRPVYDELWERYSGKIIPMTLDREALDELIENFPSIVSTVPAHVLCEKKDDGTTVHAFARRSIWISDEPELALSYGTDNVIVYDGRWETPGGPCKYRSAVIFGEPSTEYARQPFLGSSVEVRHGVKITRPTECDCCPEIVRAGRWGSWTPGVLVHHAFEKVWNLMFNEFEGM